MTSRAVSLAFAVPVLLFGCAHSRSAASTTTTSAAIIPSLAEPSANGKAHALVVEAAACWLGGLWSDAVGERANHRATGIRDRCLDVVESVGDASKVSYYPLRAVDAETVGYLAEHVRDVAEHDEHDAPHAKELGSLLMKIADASRDSVRARRAADDVKTWYDSSATTEDRNDRKIDAAPHLRESRGLHELFAYRGPYAADARAIALLLAIDRMEIARGLPKHLKVYAVEGALKDVFGADPPELSERASDPIPTGTWLGYLSAVANKAGHPVPSEYQKPEYREPFAWIGTLEGLADRLRPLQPDPAIAAVASVVIERIDDEATGVRASSAALRGEK
jgi:hypothetical protein